MKLTDYLTREDISQAEFAQRIGMSTATVSLLCNGGTWPSRRTAEKIHVATAGDVTAADFVQIEAAQ